MVYHKCRLGDLIEQYDEINTNGEFTDVDDLQGINSNKYFQKCKSNKNDINLYRYRICRNGMFSYNRATSRNGEKISIALRKDGDCIVSPSYYCFSIKDENILCSEYLDIWFKRPVFDRYARFNSWGSATEFFSFDDFCATEIILPSIDEQHKIVHDYQVVTDRIELLRKVNENLEEQAQTVFTSLFIDVCETDCTLADICNINPSRTLKKNQLAMCYEMATLPTSGSMPIGGEIKPYNGGARFRNGDTLLARITPCFENGKAAYVNFLSENEIAFGSTEYIVFAPKDNIPSSFFYYLIRNNQFKEFGMHFMNGSSGRQRISGEDFGSFAMKRPTKSDIDKFAVIGERTLNMMKQYSKEIAVLLKIQDSISTAIVSVEKGV